MIITNLSRFSSLIACAALISCLPGCGSHSDDAKPATQVAARVNGGEITVYRVNSALGATDSRDPEALARARRAVLDSLVDQELAAQAAEQAKLDRTPAVVQAIEAARREVLARAWLNQLASTQPKESSTDVARYYAGHPELFRQRRIYNIQQLVVRSIDPALPKKLMDQIGAGMSLQQISHWLDQHQFNYSAAEGARAAEQIPADILAELSKAKDGQTLVVTQPQAAVLVHIVSSVSQPVEEEAAAPRIRKFLANQTWTDAIATEIKRLKQSASITYLGDFASSATDAESSAKNVSSGTTPGQMVKANNNEVIRP